MRTRFMLVTFSLIILIIFSGCSPDFNTDFDPPKPDASLTNIFPDEIAGMKGVITRKNLKSSIVGFSSSYDEGRIVISAVKTPSKAVADEYFEFAIVPNFDKMKNHFRGNVNGKWRASGTDEEGRRWYGWVNNKWVFLLNGSDNKYFKMAIDSFKFVEE
ncbi:MAG: hypothetical protein DRQ13_09090 [Ignavibacteriae bacterium]|nr:MAG: hypothetical protein DRQ13_09090 [Ignavibacteriota bacterium]